MTMNKTIWTEKEKRILYDIARSIDGDRRENFQFLLRCSRYEPEDETDGENFRLEVQCPPAQPNGEIDQLIRRMDQINEEARLLQLRLNKIK